MKPKLKDLADSIYAHLKRFEEDREINAERRCDPLNGFCIGEAVRVNVDGSPAHPLYLPADAPLVEFRP